MKLKKPKQERSEPTTILTKLGSSVRVKHHQTIRTSESYNSAELSYGVEMECEDSDAKIKATIRRAEELVEEAMTTKFGQQRDLLNTLAKNRQG